MLADKQFDVSEVHHHQTEGEEEEEAVSVLESSVGTQFTLVVQQSEQHRQESGYDHLQTKLDAKAIRKYVHPFAILQKTSKILYGKCIHYKLTILI